MAERDDDMLAIFRKKCKYCRGKIESNDVVKRNVKVPGYIGTFEKTFCSEEHADMYEQETEAKQSTGKKCGCC